MARKSFITALAVLIAWAEISAVHFSSTEKLGSEKSIRAVNAAIPFHGSRIHTARGSELPARATGHAKWEITLSATGQLDRHKNFSCAASLAHDEALSRLRTLRVQLQV
jgi:hypothetical protein